ncbi:MAG TPA: hypothetical protein VKB69_16805 [Micromonosporaceae bacterium]|nr:hypothetical protein [Micromonosporaceae bacterium]
MTRDPGDTGPFGASTAQNTSKDWLDDFKPVQAKLSGMVDYARALNTISMNLMNHRMRIVEQMNQVLSSGAFGGGFPEVNYAATLHQQNMSEFNQYIQSLYDGIFHTANAAKAIADAYGDSDSFSAIDLNAVQFAFGDKHATRPSSLPQGIGQTFAQQAAQAAAKGGDDKKNRIWTSTGTTMNADGGMTQTYVDQFGETRTITIAFQDGHQITTTVDPTGTTVSDSMTAAYALGTYTSTTTTDQKGNVSTSSSSSYSAGNAYVTDYSSNGQLSSETDVTYNGSGSRTTTSYSYDDKGNRRVDTSVTVGQDNYVDPGVPDSPADDAINSIRDSMPDDPQAGDTMIEAPGQPGVEYTGGSGATTV